MKILLLRKGLILPFPTLRHRTFGGGSAVGVRRVSRPRVLRRGLVRFRDVVA